MTMTLVSSMVRFLRSAEGATSVECAVLLMLVVGIVITAIQLINGAGDSLDNWSNGVGGASRGGGVTTSNCR